MLLRSLIEKEARDAEKRRAAKRDAGEALTGNDEDSGRAKIRCANSFKLVSRVALLCLPLFLHFLAPVNLLSPRRAPRY